MSYLLLMHTYKTSKDRKWLPRIHLMNKTLLSEIVFLISKFEFLGFVTILNVRVGPNLSCKILSKFQFLKFVKLWIEFCPKSSFWVFFYNSSFWVLYNFNFFEFLTILFLSFSFCYIFFFFPPLKILIYQFYQNFSFVTF